VEIDSPRRASSAGDSEEYEPPAVRQGRLKFAAKSLFIQALRLTMAHHQGPGRTVPQSSAHNNVMRCLCLRNSEVIILSGLGFRGSYAIYFSTNYRCHLLYRGVHLGCIYCLFSPRNPKHVATFGHLFGRLSPVFGLKVELRKPADAESYGNAIYIANHQNNYDMVTASNIVQPPTVTVGKKSLLWIPFFGQLYWLTGNLLIDRNNRAKRMAPLPKS
jgi:hypothetical protein